MKPAGRFILLSGYYTAVLVVFGWFVLAACSVPREFTPQPQTGPIKVVLDNNYPPYVFLDGSGQAQGILIDQWDLWEKKTGIPVEITALDWNDALQRMAAGEFDVIDTIFYSDTRAQIYDFSAPYTDIGVLIFYSNKISGITDAASLRGFAVAVKSGDNAIEILKSHGVDNLIEYNSYEEIIRAARDQKIVVFVMDKPPALYFLYKYNIQNSFHYSDSIHNGQFHRAVARGSRTLLQTVENGFSQISQSEYAAIDRRWFGAASIDPAVLNNIGYGAAAILLLAGGLISWNRGLQRRVHQKTAELKALFAAMEDVVIVIDRQGCYVEVLSGNPANIYRTPKEIRGRPVSDILPAPQAELILTNVSLALHERRARSIEYSLNIDGKEIWFSGSLSPVDAEKVLLVARNITDYKQAVAALQDSENKFRLIFNTASDSILIHDLQGRLLEVNDIACQTLGYDRPELLAMNVFELNGPDDTVQLQAKIRELDQVGPLIFETVYLTKDRRTIPIELGVRIVDFQGKPAVQSIGRDISSRKHDQEKIQDLNQELYTAYDETLKGWSTALEIRERETAGHSQRVVRLTLRLAETLGIDGVDLINIRRGALLHDIGKMGIPDSILLKPSSLTADEWVTMRQHPVYAYRLLSNIPYLAPALDIPYYHHERWDGSGYPNGLKGKNIPLAARIFTVVDVWDALTSDRPYRPAWTREAAIQYLREEAGRQFDPQIVALFLKLELD